MCLTTLTKNNCLVLPQADYQQFLTKELVPNVVNDDESMEASIYQRVRTIESVLFDEYCSELLAYRQEIDPMGDSNESSRYYEPQGSHDR